MSLGKTWLNHRCLRINSGKHDPITDVFRINAGNMSNHGCLRINSDKHRPIDVVFGANIAQSRMSPGQTSPNHRSFGSTREKRSNRRCHSGKHDPTTDVFRINSGNYSPITDVFRIYPGKHSAITDVSRANIAQSLAITDAFGSTRANIAKCRCHSGKHGPITHVFQINSGNNSQFTYMCLSDQLGQT